MILNIVFYNINAIRNNNNVKPVVRDNKLTELTMNSSKTLGLRKQHEGIDLINYSISNLGILILKKNEEFLDRRLYEELERNMRIRDYILNRSATKIGIGMWKRTLIKDYSLILVDIK